MKRKITILEQRLIESGFVLSFKAYHGKHSEKTLSYSYVKNNWLVELDQKREKIIRFSMVNVGFSTMDFKQLLALNNAFHELNCFIANLVETTKQVSGAELVQSIHDAVDHELEPKQKLPPMTPEQLDELNQEKENGGD